MLANSAYSAGSAGGPPSVGDPGTIAQSGGEFSMPITDMPRALAELTIRSTADHVQTSFDASTPVHGIRTRMVSTPSAFNRSSALSVWDCVYPYISWAFIPTVVPRWSMARADVDGG